MPRLRLLGPPASDDARGDVGDLLRSTPALALLTYLALECPRGFHSRDTLMALFWPEMDQKRGRRALRKRLYEVRRALGKGAVVNRGYEAVALAPGAVELDVLEFEERLGDGAVETAVDMYRGDLLEGVWIPGAAVEWEQWLDGERARLRRLARSAAGSLARAAAERVREEAAIGAVSLATLEQGLSRARREVELAPLDEAPVARLLGLLGLTGHSGEVVQAFGAYRARREEVLGDVPSAGLAASRDAALAAAMATAGDPRSDGQSTPSVAAPAPPQLRRPRTAASAAFVAVVLSVAFLGGQELLGGADASSVPTLAVAPFEAAAGGRPTAAVRGIEAELAARLADLPVRVILDRPGAGDGDVGGRSAGGSADWLLRTTIRETPGGAEVKARLEDYAGRTAWEDRFRAELSAKSPFRTRAQIAGRIAAALSERLGSDGPEGDGSRSAARAAAYELYLHARELDGARPPTPDRHERKLRLYRRALELDPDFAEAWAWLADAYVDMGYTAMDRHAHIDSALYAVDRALELDPGLADAWVQRGDALGLRGGQAAQQQAAYLRALALEPANWEASNNLVAILGMRGELAEAMRWAHEALEALPNPYRHAGNMAYRNSVLGLDSVAEAWLTTARRNGEPGSPAELQIALFHRGDLSRARQALGGLTPDASDDPKHTRLAAALALYEADWTRARDLYRRLYPGRSTGAPPFTGLLADPLGLAWSLQRLDQQEDAASIAHDVIDEARHRISAGRQPFPFLNRLAVAHLILGDTVAALGYLQSAVEAGNRDVDLLRSVPVLEPLRDHPRFLALVAELEERVGRERSRVEEQRWGGIQADRHSGGVEPNRGATRQYP